MAHQRTNHFSAQWPVRGWLVLIAIFLVLGGRTWAQSEQPVPSAPSAGSTAQAPATQVEPNLPSKSEPYSLSPDKKAKAIAYARARYILYFASVLVWVVILSLFWQTRLTVKFRDLARRVSARLFVQSLVFITLFAATAGALALPLDCYSGFVLEHRFDLSNQGIASWLGDWAKGLAVSAVLGVIAAWIFYIVVRRSPRRWWFYSWLVSIPLLLALMVAEPYVIEPLFFHFTPLEKTEPALTVRIEAMLGNAGLAIPRSRMYEMDASAKTRTLNAYVSGLGTSKRVVVWDNTLRKMDSDETLLVLGHETGHYVLNHIPKEFALDELLFLVLFCLTFVVVRRLIDWQGARTGVEGVGDLASLPVLLLTLTLLVFLASPIINGVSRHFEHQADQFGLELASGAVADPNGADVRSFQIMGEEDLDDPDPNPFIKFWLYTHPSLEERIRFAASYKPWAEGKPLELVHPH